MALRAKPRSPSQEGSVSQAPLDWAGPEQPPGMFLEEDEHWPYIAKSQ